MSDSSKQNILRNLNNAHSHGSHFLLRLTHMSRAYEGMSPKDLNEILAAARTNNKKNGITGTLVFNKNFFLQSIEDSRPAINDLLNPLVADNRHYDLQIIESIEVTHREWPQWPMNYATPTKDNRDLYLKYSATQSFNPYLLSANAAYQLLKELSTSSR